MGLDTPTIIGLQISTMGSSSPKSRHDLAAKRQRITVRSKTLDGALHPHHASSQQHRLPTREGLQCTKSMNSLSECVVPVQDDHAILAEVESSQVIRRKYRVSVAGTGDGVRLHATVKPQGSCVSKMA